MFPGIDREPDYLLRAPTCHFGGPTRGQGVRGVYYPFNPRLQQPLHPTGNCPCGQEIVPTEGRDAVFLCRCLYLDL